MRPPTSEVPRILARMDSASSPVPPTPQAAGAFREFESLDACPLCGARASRPRFPPDVRACDDCRLLYRSPRPLQREIVRSYDAGFTYARWQHELPARDVLWRKRLRLIARQQPSGTLLDVGTGDGYFLGHAATRYDVRSTELSETGAEYARRRGFDPFVGDFLDLDVADGSVDVITLWHVLEHVPSPGEVLRKVKAALRPGGIVAIAVPNERRPLLLRWRKRNPLGPICWGEEIHLTHFLPGTLKRFMSRMGFQQLAFGVDDVHVSRPVATRVAYHAQRLLCAVTGWHFDKAMYLIGRR